MSKAQCQGKVPAVCGEGTAPSPHISKCSAAPFRLASGNYDTWTDHNSPFKPIPSVAAAPLLTLPTKLGFSAPSSRS